MRAYTVASRFETRGVAALLTARIQGRILRNTRSVRLEG